MVAVIVVAVFFVALYLVFAPEVAPGVVFVVVFAVIFDSVIHPFERGLVDVPGPIATQQIEAIVVHVLAYSFFPMVVWCDRRLALKQTITCRIEAVALFK